HSQIVHNRNPTPKSDRLLDLTSADISAIYNYEKVNDEHTKRDIENALRVWREIDNNRAIERAVDEAMDFACSQMEIRDGCVLSGDQITDFPDHMFYKLAPTLLRLKFGQSFTDEEIQSIIGTVKGSQG
ncbi:MAG: hypothetical protein OXI75_06755, partial [Rhodospirillales bacterium]|nr:hypothetical protein [Rhodospirillales bacterium]